jgi:pSer/pThr/pTyr-binding forkhead associated (FHA) protein
MPGWILHSREEPAITLRLSVGSIKTIGRTARADFIVDAALISRLHCRLTADRSDQLVVEDLGSTNGTMVNGRKVDRMVLRGGDLLTVGRIEFEVVADGGTI